ncbi:ribulose-phosphate 3-epimerase [Clostridium sp. SHJSY1]|uniref:ribulose-phosphate 3-epimerase n=1 Tax=Clostridium sp. SHJSY1 TaxID=2942483 RepID=UPI0028765384|nr:ribulose-phosphate 3-epimerase [Clostridium sp. SHJSY1]MDS0526410.1 ribulose-phosphate 3-epimerase [Clostridium sp. SHJSY1]
MTKILPSVLSADFLNLGSQIQELEKNNIQTIHIDIMDGQFVPNISFGFPILQAIRSSTNLTLDVHLMINNPGNFIKEFVDYGADIITVHYEGNYHLHRLIQQIKSYNIKAGIAINPATPVSSLKHIIHDIDLILVMGVNPGFGGQSLIPFTLNKIQELYLLRKELNLSFNISVDGGVKSNNYKELVKARADLLVVGSDVFKNNDITKNINAFLK